MILTREQLLKELDITESTWLHHKKEYEEKLFAEGMKIEQDPKNGRKKLYTINDLAKIKGIHHTLKRQEKEETVYRNINFENDSGYGVYGIYINNQLVYIGSTSVRFHHRFIQHRHNIFKPYETNRSEQLYILLREALANNKIITMKPIIDLTKEQTKCHSKDFSRREVECMEFALIKIFRPIGNAAGVTAPFVFGKDTHKDEEKTAAI